MFEKEAEDKAFEKYPIPQNWNEIEFARNTKYEEGFKDGAEFGYNKAKNEAKEVMSIAIEGIKCWGIVGGTERPFEKQAEKLFILFLDKAEQFLNSEVEK